MKCPKCGKEWNDSGKKYDFCPFCSGSLTDEEEYRSMNAPEAMRFIVNRETIEVYRNVDDIIDRMLGDLAPGDNKNRKDIRSVLRLGGGQIFLNLLKKQGQCDEVVVKRFVAKMTDEGLGESTCRNVANIFQYSVAPEGTLYIEYEEETEEPVSPENSSSNSKTSAGNKKQDKKQTSGPKDNSKEARRNLQKKYNEIISNAKTIDAKIPPKFSEFVNGVHSVNYGEFAEKLDKFVEELNGFIVSANDYDRNNKDYSFENEIRIVSDKKQLFSELSDEWNSFCEIEDLLEFASKCESAKDNSPDQVWKKIDEDDLKELAGAFRKKRDILDRFDSDGRAVAVLEPLDEYIKERQKKAEEAKKNARIITLVMAGVSAIMLILRIVLVKTPGAFWVWYLSFAALGVVNAILFAKFFKLGADYGDLPILSGVIASVHILGLVSMSVSMQTYSAGFGLWWLFIPLGFVLSMIPLCFVETTSIDLFVIPAIGMTAGLVIMAVFHFLQFINVISLPLFPFYWVWAISFAVFGVASPILLYLAFDEVVPTAIAAIGAGLYLLAFTLPVVLCIVGFRWWWTVWFIEAAGAGVALAWVFDMDSEIAGGIAFAFIVLFIGEIIALYIVHLTNYNELWSNLKGKPFFEWIGGFFKNGLALVLSLLAAVGLFLFQIIGGGFWSADFMGGAVGYGGLFNMIFIALFVGFLGFGIKFAIDEF